MNSELLIKEAEKWTKCKIGISEFNIPYMINLTDRYCSPLSKGKAPLKELIQEFLDEAIKSSLNINKLSNREINKKMQEMGIGIDCSGFAYHLLNPYVKMKTGRDLSKFLVRYPGFKGVLDRCLKPNKRYEKISAKMLLCDLNTIRIDKLNQIQIGDLIQMTHEGWDGKHPLVIVQVSDQEIRYAHSSEYVEINGAHFGVIEIVDIDKGLQDQKWQEKTLKGENYGANAYKPELGDSIRRLKCLYVQ